MDNSRNPLHSLVEQQRSSCSGQLLSLHYTISQEILRPHGHKTVEHLLILVTHTLMHITSGLDCGMGIFPFRVNNDFFF